MHLFQKLHSVTKKFFAEVLLDDLARGKIDIKSLPIKMRIFVISCIVLLCIILIFTITLYFYDSLLSGISFPYGDTSYTISNLSIVISLITYITGWTLLIMGAIWSNIITFVVISIFFFFLNGYLGLDPSYQWWLVLPLGFLTILLIPSFRHSMYITRFIRYITTFILGYRISYYSIRGTPIRSYIPNEYTLWFVLGLAILLVFLVSLLSRIRKFQFQENRFISIGALIYLSIGIIFLTIFLRRTFQIGPFIETLFTVLNQTTTYISLFWFILGFSALWTVVNLAEWTRDALEILFPKKVIFGIVFIFWALIIFLKFSLKNAPFTWDLSLLWTVCAIILAILLLYKRFTIPRILTLFQLTIFVLLLTHAYYALITETVEAVEFQWGSITIFIIGLTWLLFQGSGIIINSSSKWFPRQSRLFLFFGIIFLMLGLNHFMLVTRFKMFITTVKIFAFKGFLYTGPPFILYLWLVKRLKHHPVRPSQLAYLFIWGAILVHPVLIIKTIIYIYSTSVILALLITAIVQEYLKLYAIRKIIYRSTAFNELIDGIIYATSIGLGWAIFEQNPQFDLIPMRIPFTSNISIPPLISSILWYIFTLEFACAGFLGYGLSKTKLAGIPYRKTNIFFTRPLFFGWTMAVLYRSVISIVFVTYTRQLFSKGLIWGLSGISLLITILILKKALKSIKALSLHLQSAP